MRNSRQHWTSSWRLACSNGSIGSKKPQPRRANLCTLVCSSSLRCFFCSSWCWVDNEDNVEETSEHRSLLRKVSCDALTDFHVEPFNFTVTDVDLNIAGKTVRENNTQPFSWHWNEDDKSILAIVTSIIDKTILAIMNHWIAGLPDPSWKIRELWGSHEAPNGDGGQYAHHVAPICDNNTAARWVMATMKLSNAMLFCVVYYSQQADSTAGAQTPIDGGRSYLPLDDILPVPAEDMFNDIGEGLDDDGEMWHPTSRSFPSMKRGFQKFEWKLWKMILIQVWYCEVIRNHALGLIPY